MAGLAAEGEAGDEGGDEVGDEVGDEARVEPGGAGAVAGEGSELTERLRRLARLWDGFPTLLAREIPFGG